MSNEEGLDVVDDMQEDIMDALLKYENKVTLDLVIQALSELLAEIVRKANSNVDEDQLLKEVENS